LELPEYGLREQVRDLDSAFDSPAAKQRYVRQLFATIADRYDFITVVLSYGQDRRWKRRLVDRAHVSHRDRVIDLACGTGDIALATAARGAAVVGIDVTPRMVQIARAKAARARRDGLRMVPSFLVGDMVSLPLGDASADIVTTGYGLRNVPVLEPALDEIARVLRPGGRFLSLDFNRPSGAIVRGAYVAYLSLVGSILGRLLHGDPDTYRYIPQSILRYPGAEGITSELRKRGFDEVEAKRLLGGLMTLHVARKRSAPAPSG
jgi:demethylmenaquinone methyltransferase/2-methoxy-6-polyprenyl-1,4-benzoquinol methylase